MCIHAVNKPASWLAGTSWPAVAVPLLRLLRRNLLVCACFALTCRCRRAWRNRSALPLWATRTRPPQLAVRFRFEKCWL